MEIIYTPKAKEQLDFWIATSNKAMLKKIAKLTQAILENPYQGIGKPEALKHELAGYWSRRITQEHRFVYVVADNVLTVQSLKGHYQ
jgi:toxin YoeB